MKRKTREELELELDRLQKLAPYISPKRAFSINMEIAKLIKLLSEENPPS